MMKRKFVNAFICIVLTGYFLAMGAHLTGAAAQGDVSASELHLDLAEDHIDISTGFAGGYLYVYGLKKGPGRVAVILRGPVGRAVVRRKHKVIGLWLGKESTTFTNVPLYYDYALDAPESEIAPLSLRKELGIGLDAMEFRADGPADGEGEQTVRFREALINLRQQQDLFPLIPENISHIDDGFFKVSFDIPAGIPTGLYTVEGYVLDGTRVAAEDEIGLRIAQVGASARIFNFAHNQALAYGLFAVVLAALAGWLSNEFVRRD